MAAISVRGDPDRPGWLGPKRSNEPRARSLAERLFQGVQRRDANGTVGTSGASANGRWTETDRCDLAKDQETGCFRVFRLNTEKSLDLPSGVNWRPVGSVAFCGPLGWSGSKTLEHLRESRWDETLGHQGAHDWLMVVPATRMFVRVHPRYRSALMRPHCVVSRVLPNLASPESTNKTDFYTRSAPKPGCFTPSDHVCSIPKPNRFGCCWSTEL